jgi:hypothetical protein
MVLARSTAHCVHHETTGPAYVMIVEGMEFKRLNLQDHSKDLFTMSRQNLKPGALLLDHHKTFRK